MASDRGQNRNLYFVASKLLYAVEYCSSSRRVPLFVPSCSSFRRNLVKSSCFSTFVNSLCRRVLHFVVISLCRRSLCRRVHVVDDGISRSAVTLLFPPILALVIKTRWREK